MRRAPLLAALALAGLSACAASEPIDAQAVTLDELYLRLAPRAGEKAVLVNFWATW